MRRLAIAALFLALLPAGATAQINAGEQKPDPNQPFTMTQVTTFNLPWRIAFLPDGRMVIMSGQRILRLEPDGSLAIHADLTSLCELGWNEIVVDRRANAYTRQVST